jgi:hypothetical protein
MNTAIRFDDEFGARTIKVHNEPLNHLLPPEVKSAKLIVAQPNSRAISRPESGYDAILWRVPVSRL